MFKQKMLDISSHNKNMQKQILSSALETAESALVEAADVALATTKFANFEPLNFLNLIMYMFCISKLCKCLI